MAGPKASDVASSPSGGRTFPKPGRGKRTSVNVPADLSMRFLLRRTRTALATHSLRCRLTASRFDSPAATTSPALSYLASGSTAYARSVLLVATRRKSPFGEKRQRGISDSLVAPTKSS